MEEAIVCFRKLRHLPTYWGILLGATLLTGCASGPTQQSLDVSKAIYRSGDVRGAIQSFESAYRSQSSKDTPYYLEKGYLLRLLGNDALTQSSQSLLEADKVVSNWEAQATTDLARSSLDFMNYFFSAIRSNATYELKDYEKSMLSYTLAVNHMLAGRMDLAGVEARKMAQREKLIEALQEKKMDAIRKKESKTKDGASSRIENIKGYPINVIESAEIRALKNSYQSAAAHYLAGFIFESQDEKGLAAAGYRLAAELKPDVKLFRRSLGNLDSSSADDGSSQADTLIIVETGHVPRVYSQKITYPIPTFSGVRLVTIRLPVIDAYQSLFYLRNIYIDGRDVETVQAANLDTMVRRQLKDEMPGHVLKATSQVITQVIAQEAAYHAGRASQNRGSGGRNQDAAAAAALVGQLAAVAAGAALSTGEVDVRAWTTLPGAIYIARKRFDKGERQITLLTPAGAINAKINLRNNHELVYARVLGNGAVILTQSAPEVTQSYLKPPQPKVPESSIKPETTDVSNAPEKANCPTNSALNKFMGFWGSKKEATDKENDCK